MTGGAGGLSSGNGGSLNLNGGAAQGIGVAGNVNIRGGFGGTSGGNVYIDGGIGTTPGSILLASNRGGVGIGQGNNAGDVNASGARLLVSTGAATSTGQIIRGVASQTAALFDIQNSSSTSMFTVSNIGAVTMKNSSNSTSALLVQQSGNTPNNVLRVDTTNGRVAVGNFATSYAPAYTLDVYASGAADGTAVASFRNAGATNCTVTPGGTGFACSSDARLKTNVLDLTDATDIVSKLQGVSFNWASDPSGQAQIGFIGQDLQKLIPSAVSEDANGYLVANYSTIVPYLVEALKNQQSQLTNLTGTSLTTTILQTLSDAHAITLTGDLTVNGNVIVKGRLETNGNNSGTATVPAGQTTWHVGYPQAFTSIPHPTLTAKGALRAYYGVTNETATGFDIELSEPQSIDTEFTWQAL